MGSGCVPAPLSIASHGRELLSRPRAHCFPGRPAGPLGFLSPPRPGRLGHAGAQQGGCSLCSRPRTWRFTGRVVESRLTSGERPQLAVESSVCLLARSLGFSLCVIRLLFSSFSPVPWELHVFGNLALDDDDRLGIIDGLVHAPVLVPVKRPKFLSWRHVRHGHGCNHCSWIIGL